MKENACREHNVLNKREWTLQTLHRFLMKENACRKH